MRYLQVVCVGLVLVIAMLFGPFPRPYSPPVPTDWPPTAVNGLAGPITVKVIPDPKDEEGNHLWGSWEQSTRVIEIDSAASPEFQRHTFFHELCHAAMADSGHEFLLTDETEDALCDAIASARIQEMRGP